MQSKPVPHRRGDFPLLDEIQDRSATDYVAFVQRVGESVRLGEGEGIVSSSATEAPEGFTEAHIALLGGIMPALTLALMLQTTNRAARTLITTYLGSDAAERVLAGNIGARPGDTDSRGRVVQRPRRVHAHFGHD